MDEINPPAAAPPAADTEALVTELGTLLEQVASEPNNILLLRRQVDLMLQVGMVDEAVDTASTVSQLTFLGEGLWRRLLDAKAASFDGLVKLDALAEVLELFQTAEGEYLCKLSPRPMWYNDWPALMAASTILEQHATFLVGLVGPVAEGKATGDDEVREYLNAETLRGMLRDLAEQSNGLLSSSRVVWQPWIDWEVSLLDELSGDDK